MPYRTNVPALAHELAPRGVTALSVTPGFLRSEAMLDTFGVTEAGWREAAAKVDSFEHSETPHLLAKGLAALRSAASLMLSGRSISDGPDVWFNLCHTPLHPIGRAAPLWPIRIPVPIGP